MYTTAGSTNSQALGDATDRSGTDWRLQLRSENLRITKQRLAVITAVEQQPHATADQLLQMVRKQLPQITIQSIYIVISSLIKAGLVGKLDLPQSAARYELERHDNHHHVVCRDCGRIEDVTCALGEAPCLHPEDHHGMIIDIAQVVYQGVCHDCTVTEQSKSLTTQTGS